MWTLGAKPGDNFGYDYEATIFGQNGEGAPTLTSLSPIAYQGITKRINKDTLDNKNQFIFKGNNIYQTLTDLPQYGLNRDDEIRWETITANDLQAVAKYLSPLLKTDTVNIIYFHLDAAALKAYTYEMLEKTNHMFR